jgi:hypothetical protein
MILLKNKKSLVFTTSSHNHLQLCNPRQQDAPESDECASANAISKRSANCLVQIWPQGLNDSTTQRLSAKPCLQHANHQGLRAKENETRFAGFPVTLDLSSRKRPK